MNRTLEDNIKALELNPDKDYILVFDRESVSPQDFYLLPKMKNIKFGFFVKNINDIQLQELSELQEYLDKHRNQLKND